MSNNIRDFEQNNIEKILMFYDIPLYLVFLVLENNIENRFLGICTDMDEEIYLIVPINNENLLKILDQKITVRSFFKKNEKTSFYVKYNHDDNTYAYYGKIKIPIPNEELPEKRKFFNIETEDIFKYKSLLIKSTHPYDTLDRFSNPKTYLK
jgi:hypothetical protein